MPKRGQIYLVAVIIYASFIFYLSSIPNPPSPISYRFIRHIYLTLENLGLGFLAYPFYLYILFPDKFVHFFLYLGFGILLNLAIASWKRNLHYLTALSIGSLYAVSDEIHQIFTPFRSASFSDFLADFLGILTAQVLLLTIYKTRELLESSFKLATK
jgi:VanZ family protein